MNPEYLEKIINRNERENALCERMLGKLAMKGQMKLFEMEPEVAEVIPFPIPRHLVRV